MEDKNEELKKLVQDGVITQEEFDKSMDNLKEPTPNIKNKNNKKIILLALILIIVIVGVVLFLSKNKTNLINEENNVSANEENYVIPEDRKAIVTFYTETGTVDEEKEVDREVVSQYPVTLYTTVRNQALSQNLGIMDVTGVLYYIEFYNSDKSIKQNMCGSIVYFSFVDIDTLSEYYSTGRCKIYGAVYGSLIPAPYTVREYNTTNVNLPSIDEVLQNNILTDLKSIVPDSAQDVRIGIMTGSKNSWLKSSSTEEESGENNEENNFDNSQEINNNLDGTENLNVSNSSNNGSNINNNGNSNATQSTNNTQSSPTPTIVIDTGSGLSTKVENYTLSYSVANVSNSAKIVVKNNGKVIVEKNTSSNNSFNEKITLTEGSNTIEVTVTNTDGKSTAKSILVTYTISTPKVTIDTSSGNTTRYSSYNFSYYYTDSNTPVDVVIKVNGTVVKERKGIDSPPPETVTLIEGQNIIEVIATNSKGKTGSSTKTVIYTP